MCEACRDWDEGKSAFKTYCVGKMRDYVKVCIKNHGVKKSHLPSVEIVEFDIREDNPDAIAQPGFEDRSQELFDIRDKIESISDFLPRVCFRIFCCKYGVNGFPQMSSIELAEQYKCSRRRIQFICAKSLQVVIAELTGIQYNIYDLMLEKW
jgi:hypothetical protein